MINEDIEIERSEAINTLLDEINQQVDQRISRCKRFSLGEIFFLVLCAQICGYETFREYKMYGKVKADFLKKFLPYAKGMPSRSTIARILAVFDPAQLERLFVRWMQLIVSKKEEKNNEDEQRVTAIDGKTVCGAQGENLHLVSALDTKNRLTLGEQKVSDKSNEITAIPALLDLLSIEEHFVSIDAMGCQKSIAEKIRSKKADYFLALKKNHSNLYDDIEAYFKDLDCLKKCDIVTHTDKGHGRIETRTCYVSRDIHWINERSLWKDLTSIIMIESKRWIKGKESIEKRFFISSSDGTALSMLCASRSHWQIESFHWVLDVVFKEDSRIMWNHNIAHNEAIIRRIALNLLKQYRSVRPRKSERSEKIALKTLRKILIISDHELFQLLSAGF